MHALKTTFEILKKHSPRVLPLCFASVLSDQAILETLTSTVMQAKINFYLLGFWGMLSLVSAMVWPALIGIVAMSMLAAPFGARLAHRLPVKQLKRAFGGFLALLATKMLWTLFD